MTVVEPRFQGFRGCRHVNDPMADAVKTDSIYWFPAC